MTVKSPDLRISLLWALNAKRLIGQRVARRMEEMGYSSDEALAHDANVTVKTVWRLRNGKSFPRDDTARKVAAALNMPITDLRPPQSPDEDPELRDQLQEVLSRLQRIELAIGTAPPVDPDLEAAELEAAEESATTSRSDASAQPNAEPGREAASQ
jgi:transcriptional regulator with XRE-family HTH domain